MLSETDLESLRTKHGRVSHCRYNGVDIVFRLPTRNEVLMWRQDSNNAPGSEDENLAKKIVVVPDKEAFGALLQKYPMMVNNKKVARAISLITGVTEDAEEKDEGNDSSVNGSSPVSSASA